MLHINNREELERLQTLIYRLFLNSDKTKFPVDIYVTPVKVAAFEYGEDDKALFAYTWEDGNTTVEETETTVGPTLSQGSMRERFWKREVEARRLSRMCHHDIEEAPLSSMCYPLGLSKVRLI